MWFFLLLINGQLQLTATVAFIVLARPRGQAELTGIFFIYFLPFLYHCLDVCKKNNPLKSSHGTRATVATFLLHFVVKKSHAQP